jgi:hypothetical protein
MLALSLMMVAAMAISAQASFLLVYELPGNSGNLGGTFTQSGTTFIGTDIPIEEVYSINSSLNDGVVLHIAADDFKMNFNTSTGDITIANATRTLLTGTFTGTPTVTPPNNINISTFNATFDDSKPDQTIADFYGFEPGVKWQGSITLDFLANIATSNTLDGSVHNFAPIPGSLLLLGSGLLGIFGIGIRRKSA